MGKMIMKKMLKSMLWAFKNIKWWVIYRTTERYHIVKTGLKPDYYETDKRMLHACFNLLKEFVEVELAHLQFLNMHGTKPKKISPVWGKSWLEDDILENGNNNKSKDILELYNYWTKIYSNKHKNLNYVPELYEFQEQEEQKMLEKLIKVRSYLWS